MPGNVAAPFSIRAKDLTRLEQSKWRCGEATGFLVSKLVGVETQSYRLE
jgi:hypothetical protein